MESQVNVLNASEILLSDFTEHLGNISTKYHSNNWFIKLREIDAKIHYEGIEEKVSMSDDRNIFVVFKTMAETNMFSYETAGINEWFVVKRYLEIFSVENDITNLEDLRRFVTLHLAIINGDGKSKELAKHEYEKLGEVLNGIDYDFLPIFVLDAFANGVPYVEIKKERTVEEWLEINIRTCEMMIREEPPVPLTEEEMELWVNKLLELKEKYNNLKK